LKRRWFVAGGFATALAGGHSHAATPALEKPPEPGPPRPLVLPAFEERRLANGLRIVVAPRRQWPLVTVNVLVLAGREADPAGRAGLAAMTAELVAKGARRGGRAVDAPALASQAEALGSMLNTGSGWRSASAGMTVAAPRLPAALALLADVVRRPLLAAEELERSRAQAIDALRLSLAEPGAVAALAARRAFWGDGPYAASPTPASLQRITREDVQRFHRDGWRPQRTLLVLAGDIGADDALRLARTHFGDWAEPAEAPPRIGPVAPASITPRLLLVDMPGSGQSGVVVAAPFAAIGAADRRIGEVAHAVLGGGYSARLNQQVRIRRGLSYGASASAEPQPGGGMWTAQAQTQHATALEVLQLLREETLRLAQQPPGAAELAARQATLIGSFARRLETTAGLAAALGNQLAQGRPLAELARYVDEVQAVTPAQVSDFAARHWRAETLRAVVAGDLQAAGAALREFDPGALVRPLDGLDPERADFGG
jgi:zinc protease